MNHGFFATETSRASHLPVARPPTGNRFTTRRKMMMMMIQSIQLIRGKDYT